MHKKANESRRKFLKIGTSMVLATTAASSNAAVRFKRITPSSINLLEAGLILGPGGHSRGEGGLWPRIMNPPKGRPRLAGMIFTKVWAPKRELAEVTSEVFCPEIVSKFDAMVDKVDGIFIDDFYAVAYNYKLARPYLEAGMPTFINRPFADSVNKACDIVERARKNDAPLMTASSFEHVKEVHTVRSNVKLNEITSYEVWNASSDYYSHGLHGVWWAYAAIGGGITSVALNCKDWMKSSGGATYVAYKDRGKVGPFTGKINEGMQPGVGRMNCSIKIQPGGENYIHHIVDLWGREIFLWLPMVLRIQLMFETGKMPQTYDEILEKSTLFTGAFYSFLEKNQNMVDLDEIPEDWCIGTPYRTIQPEYVHIFDTIKEYEKLFGKEKGKLKRE